MHTQNYCDGYHIGKGDCEDGNKYRGDDIQRTVETDTFRVTSNMLNDRIQIASCCIASLLVFAVLISSIELSNAQENQTESVKIEGIKDGLLGVHPVTAGIDGYLDSLETQEAVHTLLALRALRTLMELETSQLRVL